jgi:3D (Asp-Asp-Asp) domain-containing protein
MAATPDGHGYWLAGADGGVFSLGDAPFEGSAAPQPAPVEVDAVAASPLGPGYWLATRPAPPPPPGPAVPAALAAPAGRPLGEFVVTCYDLTGRTASGAYTGPSTVAVDPSVIPLGTTIDIAGVGVRVAQDTGGAIKGDRLDIWEPTYADCAQWGVQTRSVTLEP